MLMFFGLVVVFLPTIFCLEGPYIHDNFTKPIIVEEGESPKLECYAGGRSYSRIKWHRKLYSRRNLTLPNGQSSCDCGNILELPSITKDQRGRYVCSTDSVFGSASKYIDVRVIFAPIMLESHHIDRFGSKQLELRCNGEAYPEPHVEWLKNNETLSPTKQHQIITDYEFEDIYNSTLIISTESNYHGTYECQIANSVGHSTLAFEVAAPTLRRDLATYYDGSGKRP